MYNATRLVSVMHKEYDNDRELREDTHDISVRGGRFEVYRDLNGTVSVFVRCREYSYVYLMCKRMGYKWTMTGMR